MKYLLETIDWLYFLSLELFRSAHFDRGRGVNHFYDDKRAHILTSSIIIPWISLCVCVLLHIICPNFNLKSGNRLMFAGLLIIITIEYFLIKRYNIPILFFEFHKKKFCQWNLSRQVLMMLLPLVLCILSWVIFFLMFDILYD